MISGATEVITNVGPVAVQDVSHSAIVSVLSLWDGKLCFRQMHDWSKRGIGSTAVIVFQSGAVLKTGLMTAVLQRFGEKTEWKPAGYLEEGSHVLRCATDGSTAWWEPVVSVTPGLAEDMYDFQVNQSHCFFANNTLIHGQISEEQKPGERRV